MLDRGAISVKTAVIVPTLNAAGFWPQWLHGLNVQTLVPDAVWIVDSASDDGTDRLARTAGFHVEGISRNDFNHGGTRQLVVRQLADFDIFIFMTQDAVLARPDSLEKLVEGFGNPKVGAAYGRQLPRLGAGPIEAHARFFNYPEQSQLKSMADVKTLGIKTVFFSNSFGAYRRSALMGVGGFPSDTIFGEDTYVAAQMLLAGWEVAYCADAVAWHSHEYSFAQEFRRYFDIGVFHARERWIRENFHALEGEGGRFLCSELRYLVARAFWFLPSSILRAGLKYLGLRLGLLERKLPLWVKRRLSVQRAYWRE